MRNLTAFPLLCLLLLPLLNLSASPITDRDAVRAIVGEAGNQPERGMIAVGNVIRNRGHLRGMYGMRNPVVDRQPAWVWVKARQAWAASATNNVALGATHFENTKAFGRPRWSANMKVTVVIKDHTFYKPKPKESL